MVLHAKVTTGCRSATGVECVVKRVEISNQSLQASSAISLSYFVKRVAVLAARRMVAHSCGWLVSKGLYCQLNRTELDDDLLKGVSFECADATEYQTFRHSHIYMFDLVFSHYTLEAIAKAT